MLKRNIDWTTTWEVVMATALVAGWAHAGSAHVQALGPAPLVNYAHDELFGPRNGLFGAGQRTDPIWHALRIGRHLYLTTRL